jgi:hypothetical protein
MDTDPNPEVSALLSALDDSPPQEATDTGEAEGAEELETGSADDESAQDDASDDAEPTPLKVEFDGKTWELPPGTPPELAQGVKKMADELKADYTRKTQTVADLKRQADDTLQSAQRQAQFSQVASVKIVELREISRQIEQIEAIDFNTLADEDPQQAIRLQAAHTRLIQQRDSKQREVVDVHQQSEALTAQQRQRQKAELYAAAPELIPGFNEKVNNELLEVVLHCGFTPEMAKDINSKELLKLINYARLGLKFEQQAKPQAMKKVAEAPRTIKPQAPAPKRENQSAAERLKKTGRASELINFL